MTNTAQTLERMMRDALPKTGEMVEGRGMYMECVDPDTQLTWMGLTPASRADFEGWQPGLPLRKTGIGKAAMDMAAFRHDPSGADVPVQIKTIDGYRCLNVAIPTDLQAPKGDRLPIQVTVRKGHTLGYEAERRIKFLQLGDEHFVEVVGDASLDGMIVAPNGGTFAEIKLNKPWMVELPYPTTAFFWITSKGPRSFQGPVQRPRDQSAT
ncbi:MAG: hypothetical protein AAF331_07620 [Pseudomonadota bacterium]